MIIRLSFKFAFEKCRQNYDAIELFDIDINVLTNDRC